VADDNRDAADSLAVLLELVGCHARACYDGGAVLPLAEEFEPDACVLDLWMPVADGWAVARLLREWAAGRLLLLVALTGVTGRRAEEQSFDAGFDHHILKPSDPDELFRRFTEFVARMEVEQMEPAVMVPA
jgi:two-component system, OmpR family, response regulator